MNLKDTARTVAVLSTLHDAIGKELSNEKKELETGLKAAKEETGTQKISVSLPDGNDIGSRRRRGSRSPAPAASSPRSGPRI
jgi:hypothetical protein